LHSRKYVPSAQGVTVVTNGFRELLQEKTEPAPIRGKRVTMPWHLARLAQAPADCDSFLYGKCGSPGTCHVFLFLRKGLFAGKSLQPRNFFRRGCNACRYFQAFRSAWASVKPLFMYQEKNHSQSRFSAGVSVASFRLCLFMCGLHSPFRASLADGDRWRRAGISYAIPLIAAVRADMRVRGAART